MVATLAVVLAGIGHARAQADSAAREADMFGAPSEPGPATDEFAANPRLADTLQVGGQLYLRLDAALTDDAFTGNRRDNDAQRLSSPSSLDVYLDARPNPRLRAYARGRLRHDPTVDGALEDHTTELDQLWIKFDIARVVFTTVGTQPVKWGAGRLWNPTDFVNRTRRNPLDPYDLRRGVPLVKLHVPIESLGWNLYALTLLEDADAPADIGGALRAEVVAGTAELSVSAAARRDRPLRLGADLSAGLGPVDVTAEIAVAHGHAAWRWRGMWDPQTGETPTATSRDGEWIPQFTAGVEYAWTYGDGDTLFVGAEYFFNDAGDDDPELYVWRLLQGELEPFYIGRQYAAAYAALPAPGAWNDVTFVLTGVANVGDRTGIARFDISARILDDLTVSPYAAVHLGERGGELRYAASAEATTAALDVDDDPDTPPLAVELPAFVVPAPLIDVGIWLAVTM